MEVYIALHDTLAKVERRGLVDRLLNYPDLRIVDNDAYDEQRDYPVLALAARIAARDYEATHEEIARLRTRLTELGRERRGGEMGIIGIAYREKDLHRIATPQVRFVDGVNEWVYPVRFRLHPVPLEQYE